MERYVIQLMLTKGIGDVAMRRILTAAKSDKSMLKLFCEQPENMGLLFGFKPTMLEDVKKNSERAVRITEELKKKGIKMIVDGDENYPQQLKENLKTQCPPVLFAKGNLNLLNSKGVGFCGSRKVSEKGISITGQCAKQLSEKTITVVSGYASGTDMAAHVSALDYGGRTIFVLAEGILNFSIKQGIDRYLDEENHVFISQFLPDASWNVGNAMKRNSLILGLSDAMILVESGKTGGTFAAGEEALKRKIPLFVIDFAQPEVSAEANPYFISKGGIPIRGCQGVPNLEKLYSAIVEKKEVNKVEEEQLSFIVS